MPVLKNIATQGSLKKHVYLRIYRILCSIHEEPVRGSAFKSC